MIISLIRWKCSANTEHFHVQAFTCKSPVRALTESTGEDLWIDLVHFQVTIAEIWMFAELSLVFINSSLFSPLPPPGSLGW